MVDMILRELSDFLEPEFGRAAAAEALRQARLHPDRDLRVVFAGLTRPPSLTDDELLRRFGRHLFPRLAALFPAVFAGLHNWRELLLQIAPRVHAELLTLQPEAQFPTLVCRRLEDEAIEVEYHSPRNLAPLAQGMLLGCLDYFGTRGAVSCESLPAAEGHAARLVVRAEQGLGAGG